MRRSINRKSNEEEDDDEDDEEKEKEDEDKMSYLVMRDFSLQFSG
jgi:hypothetical protein